MADWSTLPCDILGEIALKLDSFDNFVSFSAVCHSWNHGSSTVKTEWVENKLTTPWLLLAEPSESEDKRKTLSIGENKCYGLKLPQLFGKRCWGSKYGWIATFGVDHEFMLFNPITKAKLSLPSLQTLPFYPEFEGDDIYKSNRRFHSCGKEYVKNWTLKVLVEKAVVFNIDDDLFVMVIHDMLYHLALARPGDQAWTPVLTECSKKCQVNDVTDWDGKVVITYMDGSLAYCDIGKHPIKANTFTSFFSLDILQFGIDYGGGNVYIVELDGDLLVVLRYRKSGLKYDERRLRTRVTKRWSNGDCYRTSDFIVYKYVGNTTKSCEKVCTKKKKKPWKQVEDLGEHLLFLGDNIAIALHISKAPNCHQNTIYFIDDETYYWKESIETKVRGRDMGMFDMATEKIQPFYHKGAGIITTDIISEYSSPIWFMPKF